jgi:hypothetical protein
MGPSLKDSLLSVGLFFQKLHAISSHLFESSPHNRNGHKERDKVAHGTDTGKSLSGEVIARTIIFRSYYHFTISAIQVKSSFKA